MITSSHNPKLTLVRALLGRPKERREANAFVAEGVRLVEEALVAERPFRFVLYGKELSERCKSLVASLQSHGIETDMVLESVLKAISDAETSQGILAVLEHAPFPYPVSPNFVLIPDSIRDPGNLGTLLRTADAADVQAVLIPPETTDPFAPKVVRAGMGAHFRLPIFLLSWDEIYARVEGLKVYLAEMEGAVPCWQADFRVPLALIVGSEAEGASAPARQLADVFVKIPMPGGTESLNAAIAGAILMFEIVRQRET
jgi:TrmH family RNA methyltransferase